MHVLFGLLQHLDQVGGLLFVILGEERICNTFVVTTTSSTDSVFGGSRKKDGLVVGSTMLIQKKKNSPVNVVFRAVRVIEIDHVLDVFHIYRF